MRQPGPREIAGADRDNLSLGSQPSQRRAMQYPGAVPHKGTAPGPVSPAGALRRLRHPARRGQAIVAAELGGGVGHLLSLPPVVSSTAARPASSRATGTRNGEQET